MFAGELLKEMTVDYERAASEDRLDEVRVPTKTSLTHHSLQNYVPSPENHLQKPALQERLLKLITFCHSYFLYLCNVWKTIEGMLVPEPFCPLVFRCVALLSAKPIALPFPPS